MIVQDRPDFVSVAEASRILGISRSSVKRRIAAGLLDAEQLRRPQGVEYRVRIHRDVPGPPRDDPPPPGDSSDSEGPAPPPGTTRDDPAAITAAVAPLLERLAVADVIIAGHTATIREQAEIIGGLRAGLGTAQARISELEGQTAAQSPVVGQEPPQPAGPITNTRMARLRALATWVPMLIMLALAAVTLLLTLALLALT